MILTPRGARLSIAKAPEHLGPGVLMITSMVDPMDHRQVEVYLDPDAQLDLARELLNKYFPEESK